MIQQDIFIALLIILKVAFSLTITEKIEPIDLHYHCIEVEKAENEPDKSPVVMIHGILGTYRNYDGLDQIIAKRTKRKACAVDLRNHGESPWNNRTDIAAMTVDIEHFLDKHNIKRVNLIGESLGGKVALHYTLNNPDRVDSLITEDIRPNSIRQIVILGMKYVIKLISDLLQSQPEGMTQNEAKQWVEEFVKDTLHQMGSDDVPNNLTKYMDLKLVDGKWQPKHNMDLLYEIAKNNFRGQWTESTGLYTGPVLFVYGTESAFKVGDDADNILKLFPNAKLIPIEGAGHMIHEAYHEFDDIAVNFLNEIN